MQRRAAAPAPSPSGINMSKMGRVCEVCGCVIAALVGGLTGDTLAVVIITASGFIIADLINE